MLSELALRSKACWGCDKDFLESVRTELTFQADDVRTRRLIVAELADRVVGFAGLDAEPPEGELGNLWVEPESIGTGVGRRLWEHVVEQARTAGFQTLLIEADPHAEGFYLAMGAQRIGTTPSGSIPGRQLPLLRFHTGPVIRA
ncbi:GNAT family N-acetyltransferase [Actinoallomurus acaciae]|uniref:GNAT family N-acetyltransferase n=1 Tax=Actinoallomurus acaciae TaxID=502577 RepID=A0ABV5Y6U4_9ACTN